MLRGRSAGALCIVLLALWGCRAEPGTDDAARQAAATGVEAFFRYGMVELGPTRSDFQRQLGAPDSAASQPLPNPHDASITDSVITLHYPGLVADVYRAGFDGRELLAALRITSDRYLRPESPLRIDTPADELQVLLGPADEDQEGDLVYRCASCTMGGNDAVRLLIDRGALREIAVHYWIE